MKSINRTAKIVGALYMIGTVAGTLSYVFGGPVVFAQDHLMNVLANETRLVVGALFVVIMTLALAIERAMGFVAAGDDEIIWRCVHPDYYRRGIGRRLLGHAVERCGPPATTGCLAGNIPPCHSSYRSASAG